MPTIMDSLMLIKCFPVSFVLPHQDEQDKHIMCMQCKLLRTLVSNTMFPRLNEQFNYKTLFARLSRLLSVMLRVRYVSGLWCGVFINF